MNLEQAIAGWDGKSSSDIAEIYAGYQGVGDFVSDIIKLSHQPALQKGTTWLLKKHLENKAELKASDCTLLLRLLPQLEHWEARLHLLQCLPYIRISPDEVSAVDAFLRNNLGDTHKFVRAWAYNGFYELALQYPAYQHEAKQLFDLAMREEAPSVKARIRNITQQGF